MTRASFSYDCSSQQALSTYKFTGKLRDSESGRVAGPSASLISILHHEYRVARPCVFCKGGSTYCLGQPA